MVFRRGGKGPEYLILHYPAGHWDFPKGNIEAGESEEETVVREVREETGMEVRLVPGFRRRIEYFYRREEGLVHKEVYFYLAEAVNGEVRLSYEHSGYAWLGFEDAVKRVTYDNSREVLREAHEFLKKRLQGARSLDEFLQQQP